jgi:hypothetical protein
MAHDPSSNDDSSTDKLASRTLDVSLEPLSCDTVTAVTGALSIALDALENRDFERAYEAARSAELELLHLIVLRSASSE